MGTKQTERFGMQIDDLLRFKEWLVLNKCECLAVESTGTLWVPIHSIMEGSMEIIIANAYKIKHTPGRKTDLRDSEWLAELCLNGMIEPSRIFTGDDREIRELTRSREHMVKMRTQVKIRIHYILESACIKLSSVLTDIFGKLGMKIINGLLEGKTIDEIVKGSRSKIVKKKRELLRDAIKTNLNPAQILVIRDSLDVIDLMDRKLNNLESEIQDRIEKKKEDIEIAQSLPGFGFISASTLLAEIGDYSDFANGEKLASWAGIVPRVSQSADHNHSGRITKQGSKHIRRIIVEVADAVIKTRNCKLKDIYRRIKSKKGHNIAIIALGRKILCILHHLLMNREMYDESQVKTKKVREKVVPTSQIRMTIEEMVSYLSKAGFIVGKKMPEEEEIGRAHV